MIFFIVYSDNHHTILHNKFMNLEMDYMMQMMVMCNCYASHERP